MENNEQRTFESFLDIMAENHCYGSWDELLNKFSMREYEKDDLVDYLQIKEFITEAAQRFAAWKARTTAIAFAQWRDSIRKLNYKVHPEYFDITGEGSTKRVSIKSDNELYETFSGLPVEQGQKSDGWIFGSKLTERISAGLERELKRQKDSGKQRISGSELDKLIDNVIKEELGDAWKGSYAHNNSSIPLQSKKDNNETQV